MVRWVADTSGSARPADEQRDFAGADLVARAEREHVGVLADGDAVFAQYAAGGIEELRRGHGLGQPRGDEVRLFPQPGGDDVREAQFLADTWSMKAARGTSLKLTRMDSPSRSRPMGSEMPSAMVTR